MYINHIKLQPLLVKNKSISTTVGITDKIIPKTITTFLKLSISIISIILFNNGIEKNNAKY